MMIATAPKNVNPRFNPRGAMMAYAALGAATHRAKRHGLSATRVLESPEARATTNIATIQ